MNEETFSAIDFRVGGVMGGGVCGGGGGGGGGGGVSKKCKKAGKKGLYKRL